MLQKSLFQNFEIFSFRVVCPENLLKIEFFGCPQLSSATGQGIRCMSAAVVQTVRGGPCGVPSTRTFFHYGEPFSS